MDERDRRGSNPLEGEKNVHQALKEACSTLQQRLIVGAFGKELHVKLFLGNQAFVDQELRHGVSRRECRYHQLLEREDSFWSN